MHLLFLLDHHHFIIRRPQRTSEKKAVDVVVQVTRSMLR
jgi:hypothetical protein